MGRVPYRVRVKINGRISENENHEGRDKRKMLTTRKSLMFPKFHMTGDAKATRYEIIAAKTLLRDIIAKKTA